MYDASLAAINRGADTIAMQDIYGSMDRVTLVSKHDPDECMPNVRNDVPTRKGVVIYPSI